MRNQFVKKSSIELESTVVDFTCGIEKGCLFSKKAWSKYGSIDHE